MTRRVDSLAVVTDDSVASDRNPLCLPMCSQCAPPGPRPSFPPPPSLVLRHMLPASEWSCHDGDEGGLCYVIGLDSLLRPRPLPSCHTACAFFQSPGGAPRAEAVPRCLPEAPQRRRAEVRLRAAERGVHVSAEHGRKVPHPRVGDAGDGIQGELLPHTIKKWRLGEVWNMTEMEAQLERLNVSHLRAVAPKEPPRPPSPPLRPAAPRRASPPPAPKVKWVGIAADDANRGQQ